MTTTSYPTRRRTRQRGGISLFGVVGSILAVVLVLCTFRERVALTTLSDQVFNTRAALTELEAEQTALLIARETAISLDELEDQVDDTEVWDEPIAPNDAPQNNDDDEIL